MSIEGQVHPRHGLDELLSAPVRLSIMATLSRVDDIEFGAIRDVLEVSDSVLSKQISSLQVAGYVSVRKGYVGKRPRTWISASARGRRALLAHLAALRAVVGDLG